MSRGLFIAAAFALVVLALMLRQLLTPAAGVPELTRGEFARLRTSLASLIERGAAGRVDGALASVGLRVKRVRAPFDGIVVEDAGAANGNGAYFIRNPATTRTPVLISAPHRGADRWTGPIAEGLFIESRAAAAAWNSAPRSDGDRGNKGDLARLEYHPFTAFSMAFADAFPNATILQLHGFAPDKRTSDEAREADVILASGTGAASNKIRAIGACLAQVLPGYRVRLFPEEVKELGALKNAQARRLRAIDDNIFVQAELSPRLRRNMTADAELRAMFVECIAA